MSRKVDVKVEARIVIDMDEGVEVSEVLDEMDYNFDSNTDSANIVYTEIVDWEVLGSK